MLRRKYYSDLLQWKNSDEKKALLITGARQIGKTFLIREFAEREYENFAEINFVRTPKVTEIFERGRDARTMLTSLSAFLQKELVPHKTLIFFDEIQECPDARTAIKFLIDDGRFDYIESGSLLGISFKNVPSLPVGYESVLQMFPLDFGEFLEAVEMPKDVLGLLEKCWNEKSEVPESIHDKMKELFRTYVIVGGMPAVVQDFVNTKDLARAVQFQRDIATLYGQDIIKYATKDQEKIREIFESIPAELSKKNRRFFLSDIKKSARSERYENSFLWISDAGIGQLCRNLEAPLLPLKLNELRNLFKLFMNDSGLLCSMCMENVQFEILNGNLAVNMGGILENAFANLLCAAGFTLNYYDKKNIGEVDFIVEHGGKVLPIEIKSGKNYKKHAALNNTLDVSEFNLNEAIVFCEGNVEQAGKITYFPWYMILFLKHNTMPEKLIVPLPDFTSLR